MGGCGVGPPGKGREAACYLLGIVHDLPPHLVSGLQDRYTFVREIGRGGMATVYLAEDLKHRRKVAVKVLREDLAASIGADRFLKEIEIAAGLTHPHILALHDSGECDGALYYVMPFVDGESLRSRLVREKGSGGRLPLPAAAALIREVAGALTYAHKCGVIHRDIKPENVLLAEGHAVVADFGIAKALHTAGDALTRTGFPLGTPGYMSPEQAAGSTRLTAATDLYSLACVFYELVVGEVPGRFVSPDDSRQEQFVHAEPHHRDRLDRLPRSVERAMVRAMAIQPEDRHETPTAFAEAVDPQRRSSRRYDTEEAREIVNRAAELEASVPTGPALSLGGIQEIADEVGIDPVHVREAAAIVQQGDDGLVRGGLLGVRTDLSFQRTFEGEISPSDYERLLEEIRTQIGEVGRINETLGRSLSWNSLSFQNSIEGGGRLIHVMIRPEDGQTTLRITESSGHFPVVMVVGGVAAAFFSVGWSFSTFDVIPAIVSSAVFVGAGYAGVRGAIGAFMRRRHRRMRHLLDSLQRRIRDALS